MVIAVEVVELKEVNSRGSAEWDHEEGTQRISRSAGQRGWHSDAGMGMVRFSPSLRERGGGGLLVREAAEGTHVGKGLGCGWLKLTPNDIRLSDEGVSGVTSNVHDTTTHVLVNEEDHRCGEGQGDRRLPSPRELRALTFTVHWHPVKNLRCKSHRL